MRIISHVCCAKNRLFLLICLFLPLIYSIREFSFLIKDPSLLNFISLFNNNQIAA